MLKDFGHELEISGCMVDPLELRNTISLASSDAGSGLNLWMYFSIKEYIQSVTTTQADPSVARIFHRVCVQ